MKTTRRHLNEAALSISKLLGMITRMTDDEIDKIMYNEGVAQLATVARALHEYATKQKFKI